MAWLDGRDTPFGPQPCPPEFEAARTAWWMMGGVLDWAALPAIMEFIGTHDPEPLIEQLLAMRDHEAMNRGR